MKRILAFIAVFLFNISCMACPFCNREISQGIYNSTFYPNLVTMLSAFIALAVIVIILIVITTKRHRVRRASFPNQSLLSPVPLTTASVILGIGIGGFIDGIVLHQVLQWHEMLSNKIPATNYIGKSINMFWDGIFHSFCLVVVLMGIILLWKLGRRNDIDRSGRLLFGGMLAGWGLFNIVEGVIDHQLLKLHNVMEPAINHDQANYLFLAISVLMLAAGLFVSQRKKAGIEMRNEE